MLMVKYDQKLQDDAKLEIDIINTDIISLSIDDAIEMHDQLYESQLLTFLSMEKWQLRMLIGYS
jgi:hypothetical protein